MWHKEKILHLSHKAFEVCTSSLTGITAGLGGSYLSTIETLEPYLKGTGLIIAFGIAALTLVAKVIDVHHKIKRK
jgi:hypothetical protein